MGKKATWLAAVLCIAWVLPAWALSLGNIRVHSRLNQPLTASIPLSAGPGEAIDESVRVRVAPNEDYARAGLERLEFLSDLDFTVESNRIVVTSRKIAREPVVDLLLEVRWNGGRLLRQYTVLLDPAGIGAPPAPLEPTAAPPQAPAAAPPAASSGPGMTRDGGASLAQGNVGGTRARGLREDYPSATTPPLAPSRAAPSAPESAPTASSKPRTYGPVKVNETPWSVATKLRPDDGVTIEQVVIALFQWNPTAFNSALTGFRPGAILRVPDAEVIRRVDPTIAKSRLADAREKAAEMQAAAPKRDEKPPALQPLPEKPAAEKPAEKPAPAAAAPTPPTPKAEPIPPPSAETSPSTSTSSSPAASATTPEPATSATTTPPPATESPKPAEGAAPTPTPAESEPAGVDETAAPARHRREAGLLDNWMVLAGIALGALILIIIAWRLMRRPKSPGEDFATPDIAPAPAAPRAPAMPQARTAEPVFQEPVEVIAPTRAAPQPPPPPPIIPPTAPEPAAAAPAAAARQPAPFADTALTDTRQIDLEGGDALAEADFHLAYGLYDEAILLLTQAITRDPGRNDVRTKLAEAYFSANRGQEFLETARTLKDKLDPAGWEKIAVLGRQLFPADPLFGGAGKAQPAPSGETASAPPPRAPEPAPKPAAADPLGSIPFDLEPLDLNAPLETATGAGGTDLGGDLGIDLESRVNLDDSALGGDEATTKLDLARAYIDLGDNDMARGLLGEVIQQGSSEQKSTAEDLMRKLPA